MTPYWNKRKAYYIHRDSSDDEELAYSRMIQVSMDGRRRATTQDTPVRLRAAANVEPVEINTNTDCIWPYEDDYADVDAEGTPCIIEPAAGKTVRKRYPNSVRPTVHIKTASHVTLVMHIRMPH